MRGAAYIQWSLLIFFLTPLVETIMIILGHTWFRTRYRRAPGKHSFLILQITAKGKERELIQKTIATLRAYKLEMDYEIWLVIEPEYEELWHGYGGADSLVVVPEHFKARSIDKARALEWTRKLRRKRGLNRRDVKIIFIDDDTLPTKTYIQTAFDGDYDLCQGITVPNRNYAGVSFPHFMLSHMDNIRTRNCLIYCSCTQGVTGKPLFVHGEGLCITGFVEDMVGWNWPIIASDDLVFGTNAAYMGYSWGFFHDYIQLVSPYSFKEAILQRHRWTWGNIMAIANREIMPRAAAWFKAAKYVTGLVSIFASTTGAVLLFKGIAKVPPQVHTVFWVSFVCWVASYALCGWINSGGEPNRERFRTPRQRGRHFREEDQRKRRPGVAKAMFWTFRVTQTLVAGVLCPVTAVVPAVVIIYSILKGKPKRFEVIAKTHPSAR